MERTKNTNENRMKSLPQDIITESVEKYNCLFDFEGGDRLKFGDVVMATASASVIDVLLFAVLGLVLVPAGSYSGLLVAGSVSGLVASLVVGYVFAEQIREESRMRSVAEIVVLFTVVIIFVSLMLYGAIGHYNALVDENLQKMYSIGSWTNTDWYSYEVMSLYLSTALNCVILLVLGFIGLYAGSMLKPKKS
jgi:hypothetical protein